MAVACPFCKTMIDDGVKQQEKEEEIAVLDIAEVVAGALSESARAKIADARQTAPEDSVEA